MNNYEHVLKSLRFNTISDNEWRLNEVLDNDIINYATYEGEKDDGLTRYYIYKPDEPPAAKFIIVTIDSVKERLDIHFDYGNSGNCTRGMPLSFFEGIFIRLLEDKRDSQIAKIINK